MEGPAHLLPDTLIFRDLYEDRMVLRFWDYRANYSTCFSTDVDIKKFKFSLEVLSVLSKILKLTLTNLLGRHSRRRQLLSFSMKKEY